MAMLKAATPVGKITEQSVTAQLHLTPQQAQQMQRIVLAGKKVLFSKESHHLMLKELDGPGTISQKIGQGVAGLIGLLWQESKNSLPPCQGQSRWREVLPWSSPRWRCLCPDR